MLGSEEASDEVSMAQLMQSIQALTMCMEGMHQQMGDVANRLTAVEKRPAVDLPGLLSPPPGLQPWAAPANFFARGPGF